MNSYEKGFTADGGPPQVAQQPPNPYSNGDGVKIPNDGVKTDTQIPYAQEQKQLNNSQHTQNYLPMKFAQAVDAPYTVLPQTRGLAVLQEHDHIIVQQKVEKAEVILNLETSNKYMVLGPQGQPLLRCGEDSSVISRYVLGASRPMNIEIVDNFQQTVMRIVRPFKLWKKNVVVGDGQGGNLGIIRKKFSVTCKKFFVENAAGQTLYTLEGKAVLPWKFKILDTSGQEVGQVLKKWGGLAKEIFTDADTFTCFFPPHCDTTTRALLVATTLFIDLSFFEK